MGKLIFTDRAWNEYLYWQQQDKKTLKRINSLLKDIDRGSFEGIGKPEPLKNHEVFWSRRIDVYNRFVYQVSDGQTEGLPSLQL